MGRKVSFRKESSSERLLRLRSKNTHRRSESKTNVQSIHRHIQDASNGKPSKDSNGNDEEGDVPSP